jgi:hypothetical protein
MPKPELSSRRRIEEVIRELGYPPLAHLDAFAESMRTAARRHRCGLYVLFFANGEYYIGETVDIRARLAAHRRTHPDITHVSFRPLGHSQRAKPELRHAERIAIAGCFERLKHLGIHTRGIAFVPRPSIETDFDFLLPPAQQRHWEGDLTAEGLDGERVVDEVVRRRYQSRFEKFWRRTDAAEITAVLRRYVRLCIPAPRRGRAGSGRVAACRPGPVLHWCD